METERPIAVSEPRQSPPPERHPYFDTLRMIAIVAVVVIHVVAPEWKTASTGSARWHALNLIDSAARFSVPVFFMISGALFLSLSKRITARALYSRYIPRIAVAFAFWSAIYAAVTTYLIPGGDGSVTTFALRLLQGHYHLWFLYVLLGLYMATPILRALVRDRRAAWYFVGLAAVFSLTLPLLSGIPVAGRAIGIVQSGLHLDIVVGYSFYFVLGHLLHSRETTRRDASLAAAALVVGIGFIAAATAVTSQLSGRPSERFFDYLTPAVALTAAAVFLLVKFAHQMGAGSGRRPLKRIISVVSTYSFGIYLSHPLVLIALGLLGIRTSLLNPLLSVPALTLLVGAASLVIAVALHSLPRIGRYLS